jgi:hypothetical protein
LTKKGWSLGIVMPVEEMVKYAIVAQEKAELSAQGRAGAAGFYSRGDLPF